MAFFSTLLCSCVYKTSFTYVVWVIQYTTTYVNTLLRRVLLRQVAGSRMSPDFSNNLCISNMVPILCKLSFLCNREEILHLLNWRRIYCTSYILIKKTHAQTTNTLHLCLALYVTDWCLTWDYMYRLSLLPELVIYRLQMMELTSW